VSTGALGTKEGGLWEEDPVLKYCTFWLHRTDVPSIYASHAKLARTLMIVQHHVKSAAMVSELSEALVPLPPTNSAYFNI